MISGFQPSASTGRLYLVWL